MRKGGSNLEASLKCCIGNVTPEVGQGAVGSYDKYFVLPYMAGGANPKWTTVMHRTVTGFTYQSEGYCTFNSKCSVYFACKTRFSLDFAI